MVDLDLRVRTSSPLAVILEMESCPDAPATNVEAEVADVTEDIADAIQAALRTPRKLAHLLSSRLPVVSRELPVSPSPAPAPRDPPGPGPFASLGPALWRLNGGCYGPLSWSKSSNARGPSGI
ncbi:hypothetical protein HMI49_04000 [Corallococcus exercitus]|uniref:Uncharacterized protein n=1 Tax=Corallococcus exercitus TaxID=2316736 RepID=A0A7Y4NQP1_9BACT|nr:hypothetical protein [Corallococcus exercitus]NOK32363.1 hypothetical protein [Corallococcus exercitus]